MYIDLRLGASHCMFKIADILGFLVLLLVGGYHSFALWPEGYSACADRYISRYSRDIINTQINRSQFVGFCYGA